MVKYLESKTLSSDSKMPIKKGYWNKKHLNDLRIVYTAIINSEKEGNIFDVRTLYKRKLQGIDLLTYSFPCQDISQQGKQNGIKKNSNSRSGLLWEIEKALDATFKKDLPKYLLMENVMGLTFRNYKDDLDLWKKKLEDLGYKNDLKVLNAGDFGSSQARKRAFMLSTLKKKVELPIGNKKPKAINWILDKEINKKDFLPALDKYDIEKTNKPTKSNILKSNLFNKKTGDKYSSFNSENYVYDPKYTGPTLTASGANSRIKIIFEDKIKKLNANEAYRYMGFTNKDFKKVNDLNFLIESKIIFTAGNSISIEVLKSIMKKIIEENKDD